MVQSPADGVAVFGERGGLLCSGLVVGVAGW